MTGQTVKPRDRELCIQVPTWQIIVVLLLPLLYVANARMPWAQSLWVDLDKSYYYAFWLSIVVIYFISAGIVFRFMKRSRITMSDIGFHSSNRSSLIMVASLVALGLLAVVFRIALPYANTDDLGFQIGWPVNTLERLFWIPIYIGAGFFEELVYRGFAIPALRGKSVPTWLVVVITSVAFSLIHGAADWLISGLTFVLGVVFALIFLWRRNLALVMIIHALADWGFLLTP